MAGKRGREDPLIEEIEQLAGTPAPGAAGGGGGDLPPPPVVISRRIETVTPKPKPRQVEVVTYSYRPASDWQSFVKANYNRVRNLPVTDRFGALADAWKESGHQVVEKRPTGTVSRCEQIKAVRDTIREKQKQLASLEKARSGTYVRGPGGKFVPDAVCPRLPAKPKIVKKYAQKPGKAPRKRGSEEASKVRRKLDRQLRNMAKVMGLPEEYTKGRLNAVKRAQIEASRKAAQQRA